VIITKTLPQTHSPPVQLHSSGILCGLRADLSSRSRYTSIDDRSQPWTIERWFLAIV